MRSVCLFAAWTLWASAGQAAPLTFDTAVQLSQSSPTLAAKSLDVVAARSAAVAAGRLPDPKLQVGVEGFPVSGPTAWRPAMNDFSAVRIGEMQDVPSSAKRSAARERARADIDAAEAGVRVEARGVRLAAALAWIDLFYAKRKLAALDEIDHALAPLRETAPAQLAAGNQRPAQTLEADELAAALGDRRADLVAAIGKARAALTRWTDDSDPDTAGDPPSYELDPVGLRAGLDKVPSLAAFDPLTRQAEADLAAARAEKRSDWSWELAYQHRDPMWGDMISAGATVSLPLFASKRQDPIIAARAQTASRVRIEREAERRALVAALEADLADHAMHHDRLHRAQTSLVPLAKRKADFEIDSYGAGTATLSDALNALLALADVRADAIEREADVGRDAVRIVLTYGAAIP